MAYKVLVADDQALPRQLFENIIEAAENYELAACVDSAKLVDIYCANEQIDLIIMDVVMSDGSNGLDTAARIRASYPQTRIIIVTSMPDAVFLSRAREIGVDSFWYKEVLDTPMLELMDRTMAGESIFPDNPPEVKLGNASSLDFTEREMDVLRQLVQGRTDKEIADRLELSYHTVRFHINSMLNKTNCATRTELAIRAARTGLIVPDL